MKVLLGRYTYDAPEGTKPGDQVRIPATWVDRTNGRYKDRWETVDAVGPSCSTYDGPLTSVLEVRPAA